MAHIHKKMKKGRPYYYVREIKRVNGKPKVVNQVYLGSADNILKTFKKADAESRPQRLQSNEFGSLFIADLIEQKLDTIGLINKVVPKHPREKGPSIGEYFYYAWMNRLIDPKSKRSLENWYNQTAIQEIRPVDLSELTSQRYWAKWDRVSSENINEIADQFFRKVWQHRPHPPEAVLFDTTNYFTYMASDTPSELCQRGHNKESKHHLRQVGVALMVERESKLPLFYREYDGNMHDSRVFGLIMDEMFGTLAGFNETKQRLTVVFDKGMNSEENITAIDDNARIHFITTYSPFFVEDLAGLDVKHFSPLDIKSNQKKIADGLEDDVMVAYRTRMELWGTERTVVVTHNPTTMRKKIYTLERKLESLREALLEFRRAYREGRPHWRNPEAILERYARLCEKFHVGTQYYRIEFGDGRKAPDLSFRKDVYQITKAQSLFGRNIIVTDNHDWTTEEIVQLSLDRYIVESSFRSSKDKHHTGINPIFHWTDSKIRCHLLTCIIALTVQRLIEMQCESEGILNKTGNKSAPFLTDDMRSLHSALLWHPQKRKPLRCIEDPTPTQSEVLKAFGWQIVSGGVLQKISP